MKSTSTSSGQSLHGIFQLFKGSIKKKKDFQMKTLKKINLYVLEGIARKKHHNKHF